MIWVCKVGGGGTELSPTPLFCFQIIKDFYLLGRGELYQVFIDLAQHMLKTPPTAVTEHGKSHQTLWLFRAFLSSASGNETDVKNKVLQFISIRLNLKILPVDEVV